MIFEPSTTLHKGTIDFGNQKGLKPVTETKWLEVMLGSRLSFKSHCDDVIAKGGKWANFLSSLSNTKWGIPLRLFKILITATVHAATDYAAGAWLSLPMPKFCSEKPMAVDAIYARKALAVLRDSPPLYLRHNFDLKLLEVRLTAKILNTMALIAAKSPSHPLHSYHTHTQ